MWESIFSCNMAKYKEYKAINPSESNKSGEMAQGNCQNRHGKKNTSKWMDKWFGQRLSNNR